jgi:hypothetical protein
VWVGLIGGDQAVADADDPAGVKGNLFFVGDHDDGVSTPGQFFEEAEDLDAGLGIQIPGGLVGQDDGRRVYQGSGDGDALTLSARQFVRTMMHAVTEAHVD